MNKVLATLFFATTFTSACTIPTEGGNIFYKTSTKWTSLGDRPYQEAFECFRREANFFQGASDLDFLIFDGSNRAVYARRLANFYYDSVEFEQVNNGTRITAYYTATADQVEKEKFLERIGEPATECARAKSLQPL